MLWQETDTRRLATVLVIGASRGIGLEAVRQALGRGHTVRAFARSAADIPISDAKLEKRSGSALNPQDVAAALDGVDAVILSLGIAAGPAMVFGPVRLFSDATRLVVSAMENAGVSRLICVTGFGAGDSRSRLGCLPGAAFHLVLGRAYRDKGIQEDLIRQSRLKWVIARPVILTNGPRTGRYQVLADPGRWRNGLISRADVADFLVTAVDDDTYLGKTPVLTG